MLVKGKKDLIIVPFDFTPQSETALMHASTVAIQSEDEVRLLHIVNSETNARLKKISESHISVEDALKKFVEENEKNTGVKTTYHSEEGSIFTNIGKYIESSGASLAVMGTHGVHGVQHIIGANSLRVVASSPAPMVIVQKRKISSDGYKRIVLPIDHNKKGKNKTAYAIAVAKYFNSEVYVFESHESDQYVAHQVAANAAHAIKYLSENNIPYKHEKEESGKGSFSKQLIRYAGEVDADLIVISSDHDRDSLTDFFIPNTEVQIINNDSQIAVMCVNPVVSISKLDINAFNW